MTRFVVAALKVVIALALTGSLVVEGGIVPLLWLDLDGARSDVRVPLVAIVVLAVVALQVIGVCVWRLLTLVRRGSVFSSTAFRYVDVIIGAIAAGAVLVFGIGVVAAHANRTSAGDEVAPGLVAMVCGASMVVGGVALLVFVLRTLLAQAVALDARARVLQAELNGVI